MIRIREFINDTHSTVDNPIAKSIIKGVCAKLGVKGKIALTKNGREYANKHWSTGNKEHSKDGVFPLVITCSYTEEYSKGSLVNSNLTKSNSKPVFKDEANNISIDVAHTGLVTLLEMSFRSKSDNLITSIENRLRLMRMENMDTFELRALYKYFMTDTSFDIVSLAGEDNMEDFMAGNTDSRFTLISTINGDRTQYGFKVNTLIQVTVTSETDTEKSAYESADTIYVYNLSLRYMYERPTYMDTSYDYTINGKSIPDYLLPKDNEIRLLTDLKNMNLIADHNSVLDFVYGTRDGGYYIRIPEFDRHTDIETYSPYTTIFSVLITSNPDGSLVLFNLNNLGDLTLRDVLLELLKQENLYIFEDSASIFKLVLFCGNEEISSEGFTVDEELNVIAPSDFICNGSLRVLFQLINDSSYLKKVALDRLKEENAFNLVKGLGILDRDSDIRDMSFRLGLPGKLSPEYVIAYSDIVINYVRKV